MAITREKEVLQKLLQQTNLLLSQKLAIAIERYIAELPIDKQPMARQQLPFLVQFWPLLLRYWKDISLFSWVNPSIRNWWLTEYDKHTIYECIPAKYMITHVDILETTFPGKECMSLYHQQNHIQFPCMLKANVGERGVGIYFISTEEKRNDLMEKYEHEKEPWQPSTLQTFCDWPEERCLQFYRHPDHWMQIWSLVKRNIPYVIGNAIDTVKTLIAKLPLSESQQKKVITTLEHEEPETLIYIPYAWQSVQVVRKASIDFWTTYTDVTKTLATQQKQQLNTLLEDLLAQLPRLFVGRFDIKAKSLDWLLWGELRIIECNAWWWIPTHVYDESLSIQEKYAILEHHFETMKEIATINKTSPLFQKSTLGSFRELVRSAIISLRKKWITIPIPWIKTESDLIKTYKQIIWLMK